MKYNFKQYIGISLHRTDLVLLGQAKQAVEPLGVTPEQNLIMMLLWSGMEGITQKEIAARIGRDQTNVARMLLQLEKKGFITRTQAKNDRRAQMVRLTDTGRALEHEVIEATNRFHARLLQGLTKEEVESFMRVLAKLEHNATTESAEEQSGL
ncbi:MAG: MarR family transcriptional regulator [Paenibacillus sp.]|uniref:MarR family winged helix-turn-helix transcriptional regulator n=1 Tax=Paenibacillus aquistagni TaxID=1852522 RepID=UPI000B50A39B|nr:MarR family transcriptional regulator [Paenibacillus aquistagni]MBR2569213.1 MarR family transcriptional regulator [Paenibacillus sp.]NMM52447.1 MarR family transcriptional regulator [Paenibacillus aquistagni]